MTVRPTDGKDAGKIIALNRGYEILGYVRGDLNAVWKELSASPVAIQREIHPSMASAGGISGPSIWFDMEQISRHVVSN